MMQRIKPRWRKVVRDLWLSKGRTLIVVLSIALGVFAVGVIAISEIVLSQDLTRAYLATNPAHATIYTIDSFGDGVVRAVGGMREVGTAEARRRVSLRFKTGPDSWRSAWFIALPDYNAIKIDRIAPETGAWPPPKQEVLIERAALGLSGAKVGDTITVKRADGKERQMRIAGLVHDLNAQMFVFDGVIYGFISPDTLEWLGAEQNYNELRLRVADPVCAADRACVQAVASKARDKIEASGRTVFFTLVPSPGQPPLYFLIQAIAIIMGTLGFLSLLLSGFLVINTIAALLTQQTRQIGMMKAIGARTGQIVSLYLLMVLVFGLLALLVAVPLGVVAAYGFSRYIAGFLNFDVTGFRLPPEVLALQGAVGLLVPLVAALYPVLAGARVTVREAISSYGLGRGRFGSGTVDRMLVALQNLALLRRYLSRPLLISLRNTFRRKTRLALTLATLILAGAIFVAVFSVRASLLGSLDNWLNYFQYDVGAQLDRGYRIERITAEALQVPGVARVESWGFYNGRRLRPDGTDSDNIIIFAPPANTSMVKPAVVEGRWLVPEDQNAVVVNTILFRDEPDLGLGDEIVLKLAGREKPFQIVGVVEGGSFISTIFINYPHFAKVTNNLGRGEWAFIVTEQHNAEYQQHVARALERHFERVGIGIELVAVVTEERAEAEAIFEVIVVLLLVMAVLLAVIGGLGLMGTMSINVLERTREIGVMRAIGAADRAVRRIFIIEGIIIGLLSWLAGAILAYPISKLLSDTVGEQFLSAPLDYTFSVTGVVTWLVVVVILAAVASFLPAWNASRLTVREVLAYE